jgi:hypothetical protein
MLSFPSEGMSSSKPRVIFRSFAWQMGQPALSQTKGMVPTSETSSTQLYLPGGFSEGFGARWGEEDVVTALVDRGTDGSFKSSGLEAIQNGLKQYGGLANSARFEAGATAFPGKFLVFQQGESITLNFEFELVPRNAGEASQIGEIVKNFKKQILPIYAGSLLHFPDAWTIQFLGIKNLGFPDTADSYQDMALKNAVASYGGGKSALVNHDEQPVITTLKLTFQSIKHAYLGDGA